MRTSTEKKLGSYSVQFIILVLLTILLLATSVSALTCAPANPAIASWWTGDTDGTDISSGLNGALQNGALAGQPGQVGGAFTFDGVDSYVGPIGSVDNFSFVQNTGVFTFEGWVKIVDVTSNTQGVIFASAQSTNEKGFSWEFVNNGGLLGQLRFTISKGSTPQTINALSPQGVITDNNWHHVAVTGDGTNLIFYVDGTPYVGEQGGNPVTMGVLSTGPSTRPAKMGIIDLAGQGLVKPFFGSIDELSVYPATLSEKEIKTIFNHGAQGKCKSTPSCRAEPSRMITWWNA
jgi:hypothetical protein